MHLIHPGDFVGALLAALLTLAGLYTMLALCAHHARARYRLALLALLPLCALLIVWIAAITWS